MDSGETTVSSRRERLEMEVALLHADVASLCTKLQDMVDPGSETEAAEPTQNTKAQKMSKEETFTENLTTHLFYLKLRFTLIY